MNAMQLNTTGFFNTALKQQPGYAPAILNLAVTEIYLNNPSLALQKYQEYLALEPRPNQDTPLMDGNGKRVLFGNDVWEHAYYLKYNNRRPEYLTAWWNAVNWDEINHRYEACKSGKLEPALAAR